MSGKQQAWIENWMTLHAVTLLSLSLLSLWISDRLPLLIGSIFSFAYFFLLHRRVRKSWRFVTEPANLVSGLRLLAVLFILWTFASLPKLTIAIIATLVLMADGLDGFLARKYQTVSDFGAYLDMETDALFVLSLCFILNQMALFGLWVLLIGLLRYGYFLSIRFFKPPEQKERRVFRARLIAVILMGSLIACFVLSPTLHQPLLVLASGLVIYSFADGFWAIWKGVKNPVS